MFAQVTLTPDMLTFVADSASDTNGDVATYTFSFTSAIPHLNGDSIEFTIPPEIVVPSGTLTCGAVSSVTSVSCLN